MQEFLYTEDDMQPQQPTGGNYEALRNVVRLATGKEVEGAFDYDSTVDEAWRSIAPELQNDDYQLMEDAAGRGDVPAVEYMTGVVMERGRMAAEVRSRNYDEQFQKTKDLTRKVAEDLAFASAQVLANNTPQSIAEVDESEANKIASVAALQKEVEDAATLDAGKVALGVLHELSPIGPLQGWRMQEILTDDPMFSGITKEDVSLMTGRNEIITMLQGKYNSLPSEEEKLEWLNTLYKKLDGSMFTNKLYLASVMRSIIGEEDLTVDGFSDWADRAGVALLPLQIATAWWRIGPRLAKASQLSDAGREIAKVGGKHSIEAAEAAKVANKLATMERTKAAVTGLSELSGVQGVLDLSKLASVSIARVLPEAVTTAASGGASQIRNAVKNVIDNLKETTLNREVSSIDTLQELRNVQRVYSTANNPLVHTSGFRVAEDGLSIVGKVFYKPEGSSSFATRAAAEEALRRVYGGKGKVVPDTTNNGFLVEDEYVRSLELERNALLAQQVESLAKAPKRARKAKTKVGEGAGSQTPPKAPVEAPSTTGFTEAFGGLRGGGVSEDFYKKAYEALVNGKTTVSGVKDPILVQAKGAFDAGQIKSPEDLRKFVQGGNTDVPAALLSAKPRYKTNELSFADPVDKAAYQVGSKSKPSKSDNEIKEWLKLYTGWDDARIAEHAEAVRNRIKAMPDVGEAVRVPKLNDVLPPPASKGGAITTRSVLDDNIASNIFIDKSFTKDKNIIYSSKVPSGYILPFINNLSKALGMGNHRVAVLQLSDIVNKPEYASVVALYRAQGTGTKGLHIPTRYGSVIIMGADMSVIQTGKNATKAVAYMELFAHEYAHAFEFAFQFRYQDNIKMLYKQWLSSKGLKFTTTEKGVDLIDDLPLEALLEYRSISDADITLSKTGLEDFVSKYFAGNKEAYLKIEKDMHTWLSSYHEFFAENFAKWALTDEVPTTILGTTFAKFVDGVRSIAATLSAVVKRMGGQATIGATSNVSKFLNDHIKSVKAGSVMARDLLVPQLSKVSKSVETTPADVTARVLQIEEELAAIDAARKGLTHGWLIEKDVKSIITYDKAGGFSEADTNSAVRFAFGDWTLEANNDTVTQRLSGMHGQSRYLKLLTEFIRPSIEKLNKAEKVDLNSVLVKGDQEGRVFDEATLAGEGLSPRTRETYYRVRALRDLMWQIRNDNISKVLTRKGFLDLNLHPSKSTEDMPRLFGKMVDPSTLRGRPIYNVSEAKSSRVGDNFDKEDLIAFELPRPEKFDGKYYTYIAVKSTDVKPQQITEALPYRTGEYSRHYEDEYWVKLDTNFDVDGVAQTQRVPHRTAATSQDAKAYADAFNDMVKLYSQGLLTPVEAARMQPFGWQPGEFIEALRSGEFGSNPKMNVYFNRTDDDFTNNDLSLGGILGGKRGERIKNVYGNENTLNPIDSIASEISNTAYVATVLDWREGQIAKWWNTYFADFPAHIQAMKPEQAMKHVLDSPIYQGSEHRLAIARNTAKYIQSQLNIPTQEEKVYMGAARIMAERFEGKAGKFGEVTGAFFRQSSNWPEFVRAIAFHSYMGAFNIKHLFMQSMNAFNAVAINPAQGLPAARASVLYGLALFSDNEKIWRQLAVTNKVTTLGIGMSVDEFVETVRSIRRAGILDGIQFNSMWGAEGGKFGMFNGFTRTLGKVSAAPFNVGDGYSRLVAFDIARREWKAANPGKMWNSDDAIQAIVRRADDLTQNMTNANRTNWQRGWKSIPAQFTQYQVKIALNLFQSLKGNNRTFTRKEAALLFIGHTTFLGMAGWGIMPDEWLDEATKSLPVSERLAIEQGLFSWGIHMLTGGEATLGIGSAYGTFNYYTNLYDAIMNPETGVVELLAGAGGAAAWNWYGKAGQVVGTLYDNGFDEASVKDGLSELATGFSSFNNAHKAVVASRAANNMKSVAGKNLYQVTDLELFFEAVGIPSVKKHELDKYYRTTKARDDDIKSEAKEIGRRMKYALDALERGDQTSFEHHQNAIKLIMLSYQGDVYTQNELRKAIYRLNVGTELERKLVEQLAKDLPTPGILISPFLEN